MTLALKDVLKSSLSKESLKSEIAKYLQKEFMIENTLEDIKEKLSSFQDYCNRIEANDDQNFIIRIVANEDNGCKKYTLLIVKDGVKNIYDSNKFSLEDILKGSVEEYQENFKVIGDVISSLIQDSWLFMDNEITDFDYLHELKLIEIPKISSDILRSFKSISGNFQSFQIPEFYKFDEVISVAGKIAERFKESIKPVVEQMKVITESITKTLSSLDFETLVKNMKKAEKRKLSRFLQYDWYFPIFLLEDLPIIFEFDSVSEADNTATELLDYYRDKHGYDLNDFIPKSLKTYNELKQIDYLLNAQMYKLTVIYCLERIENRIKQMQQNEDSMMKYSKLKVGKGGYNYYMDVLKEENDYLENLVSKITIDQRVHLFDRFVDGMEYKNKQGEYPLNRNLFLHGFIDDSEVNETMAKKSILAYGFFESLFLLKYETKGKIRRVNGKSNRIISVAVPNNRRRCGFSTI
ncbi:hypothetical protein CF160_03745 [Enterococcus pseudoavium]|nr:hypothetical protein CF160_03745 [Enterococcus pseudoavium]